jgi:hypothetical protein
MKRKRTKAKPMTCVACDFNKAALQDAADQLQDALGTSERLRSYCDNFEREIDRLNSECLKTASLREELASLKAEREKLNARYEEAVRLSHEYRGYFETTREEGYRYLARAEKAEAMCEKADEERNKTVLDYNKLWQDRANEVEMLEGDLAHQDERRRELERDNDFLNAELIKQQQKLAIYAPFCVKSNLLANVPTGSSHSS